MALPMKVGIFGQQPLLQIYTQLSSLFSLPDGASVDDILKTLDAGLHRLSANFPWTAGQVINKGASKGNSGEFSIVPLYKTPRLIVKDLRHDPAAVSLEDMRKAGWPMEMVDESVVAGRRTLPGHPSEPPNDPMAVLILQVTIVRGGLILTSAACHNTMDIMGQAAVMRLFSKACHGTPFTEEELRIGNMGHVGLFPLMGNSEDVASRLADQIVDSSPSATAAGAADQEPPPQCSWAYFSFSNDALSKLKAEATKSITSGFVSTDDALTALVWQSATRARLPRLPPNSKISLARAVDARHHLGVPETYPGLLQNMAYNSMPLEALVEAPLGQVASALRGQLNSADIKQRTQALATYMERLANKSDISFIARMNVPSDVMLSSWCKVSCDDDFNMGLGKPENVLRPRFTPVESLVYLMPKSAERGIAVGICLRDEEMDRLKNDEGFVKYGKFVG